MGFLRQETLTDVAAKEWMDRLRANVPDESLPALLHRRQMAPWVNLTRDPRRVHGTTNVIAIDAESPEQALAVEVAMQWNVSYSESVHTFANTINTHEGGTHEEGFRAALTNTVNKWGETWGLIKKREDRVSGDDIREGYVNVDLYNPKADRQDDARTLAAYLPGSVAEIRAEFVLEHFGHDEGEAALRRWHELLKPDGRLVVVVPDVLVSIHQWLEACEAGISDIHTFSHHLWGTQESAGLYHKWGYTEWTLRAALEAAGALNEVLRRADAEDCGKQRPRAA